MAEFTKIEWCTHTWNPWFGCQKVGPACDFCYAEALMDLRYGKVRWGAGEDRVRTSAQNWREPLKWNRAAADAGRIDTVFCLSLGDIWDNAVDPRWRHDAFGVMEQTPHLLYLLLSKRIGNAKKMCDPRAGNPCLPTNAALGATMANQEEWDRDLPKLKEAARDLGARFTFASVEPMLGRIYTRNNLPDWVIVGGESGQHARPMHPDWARSLRDQCTAAGVPFFFKQHGSWSVIYDRDRDDPDWRQCDTIKRATPRGQWLNLAGGQGFHGERVLRVVPVSKKRAGRLLDGVEHNAMPTPQERS